MTAASSDTRRIQPLDLAAERELLGDAMEEALCRVLRSGQFVLGPEVDRLEAAFAELTGTGHAIGVASGSDALILSLKALGLQPGDHVITSPFTFFASAGAIAWLGGVPRFADIDPRTGLLDPKAVAEVVDERTRGIMPVHLYGQMADAKAFEKLSKERGLYVVEDGSQAHGAHREGIRCGELGDTCGFSFYPTKNLGAGGEAGMIVTRNEELAARLKRLRDHGMNAKYTHAELGTNSRLDAFQAALLNVKLPHLEKWTQRRNQLADAYDERLQDVPRVRPLERLPSSHHVFHQYAVRIEGEPDRDAIQSGLAERGIFAGVHYPRPVHVQEAARPWGYGPGDFPHAEALAREVLCLPVHPFLADEDVERVVAALADLTGRNG